MDIELPEEQSRVPIGRVAQVGLLALVVVLVMIVIFWRPGAKSDEQAAEGTEGEHKTTQVLSTGPRPHVVTTTPKPSARRAVRARVVPTPRPRTTVATSQRPQPETARAATRSQQVPALANSVRQPATATAKVPGGSALVSRKRAEPRKVVYHTVTDQDTLYRIAKKYYGRGTAWRKIAQANKLANPDRVPLGTRLVIPSVSAVREPVAKRTSRGSDPGLPAGSRFHVVQSGDNYIKLAVRYYGSKSGWRKIQKVNGFPEMGLPVGKKIVIPAK